MREAYTYVFGNHKVAKIGRNFCPKRSEACIIITRVNICSPLYMGWKTAMNLSMAMSNSSIVVVTLAKQQNMLTNLCANTLISFFITPTSHSAFRLGMVATANTVVIHSAELIIITIEFIRVHHTNFFTVFAEYMLHITILAPEKASYKH